MLFCKRKNGGRGTLLPFYIFLIEPRLHCNPFRKVVLRFELYVYGRNMRFSELDDKGGRLPMHVRPAPYEHEGQRLQGKADTALARSLSSARATS